MAYALTWIGISGATAYDIDESPSADFAGAVTQHLSDSSVTFQHQVTASTPFFYRVRAISGCDGSNGKYSAAVRVVVLAPPAANRASSQVEFTAPFGMTAVVSQNVEFPLPNVFGKQAMDAGVTIASSQPWLTATPASSSPANSISLVVAVDPKTLPQGTSTASLTVTSGSGTPVATVPVSISLVTPVTSGGRAAATSAETLIIPAVAHADGNHSKWQSDVRLSHTYAFATRYTLTFTPSGVDGTQQGQQTIVSVQPGQTLAFDDILGHWFGAGALGDSATGLLEIRALDAVGQGRTLAASRLYDVTDGGSFGQFVPAVPLSAFGRGSFDPAAISHLALTQLADSASYRTNLGLVEGSGQPATVQLDVFDASGAKLLTQTIDLKAGEHRQLSSFLAANGLQSANARIDAHVISPAGQLFAYASVVDNSTGDPSFIPAVNVAGGAASRRVIAGVADLANDGGKWQSDLRIFNASLASADTTIDFIPQGATEPSATHTVTIAPGETLAVDDALKSLFGVESASGALRISTATATQLVATARTYNRRAEGTYGQFIPSVSAADAIGLGDRPVSILQLEESPRFRSNVGIAEVSGSDTTVELTATVAGSKVAATARVDLKANEFRQLNSLLHSLGMSDAYNASVTLRVVGGNGKVIGYGSVIDNRTQDPTYVMAQ